MFGLSSTEKPSEADPDNNSRKKETPPWIEKFSEENYVKAHFVEKRKPAEGNPLQEASQVFEDCGYNVEHHDDEEDEKHPLCLAWKIHIEKEYNVLNLIAYTATSREKTLEDKKALSKHTTTQLHNFLDSKNHRIETRKIYGIPTPHHKDKQLIIIADKLLTDTNNSGESYDPEVVPLSSLPHTLLSREESVLERARLAYRPQKFQILEKAVSKAKKGLYLTLTLIGLLTMAIYTPSVPQTLLTLNSILIAATIATSVAIHELGVARFKKLLREELQATIWAPKKFIPHQPAGGNQPPKKNPKTHKKEAKELHSEEAEAYIKSMVGGVGEEFYRWRKEHLWNLARRAYERGEWRSCVQYLGEAVSSALRETYIKLTGTTASETPTKIVEVVCSKTGLNAQKFHRFLNRIDNPSPEEASRLLGQAQILLSKLQSQVAGATLEASPQTVEEPKEELGKGVESSEDLQNVKEASISHLDTKTRVGRRRGKSGGRVSVEDDSKDLLGGIGAFQGEDSGAVGRGYPVEVLSDGEVRSELRRLLGSGEAGSQAFLVVTGSGELVGIVETLRTKYPGVPIGIYKHADAETQIIVSRDGRRAIRIGYKSPQQLEKLIKGKGQELM
ncbi:MAG: hypothetical protein QXO71_06995 [Candidatus Jordarchaeaceae archaeon]